MNTASAGSCPECFTRCLVGCSVPRRQMRTRVPIFVAPRDSSGRGGEMPATFAAGGGAAPGTQHILECDDPRTTCF